MARKFRLVTESEYKYLQNIKEGDGVEEEEKQSLTESKKKILNSDLPNEIKTMLYQDIIRQINIQRDEIEKRPIYVKNISSLHSDTSTPPKSAEMTAPSAKTVDDEIPVVATNPQVLPTSHTSEIVGVTRKQMELAKFFKEHGYTTPEGGLQLGFKTLNSAQGDKLLRCLANGSLKCDVDGFNEAITILRDRHAPLSIISQKRHSLIQKSVQPRKKLRWTTYKD